MHSDGFSFLPFLFVIKPLANSGGGLAVFQRALNLSPQPAQSASAGSAAIKCVTLAGSRRNCMSSCSTN